jgi:hypothetical protein
MGIFFILSHRSMVHGPWSMDFSKPTPLMKQRLLAFVLLFAAFAQAQEVNIIPKPTKAEIQPGSFVITPTTSIVLSETGLERSAQFLNDYMQKFYGFVYL